MTGCFRDFGTARWTMVVWPSEVSQEDCVATRDSSVDVYDDIIGGIDRDSSDVVTWGADAGVWVSSTSSSCGGSSDSSCCGRWCHWCRCYCCCCCSTRRGIDLMASCIAAFKEPLYLPRVHFGIWTGRPSLYYKNHRALVFSPIFCHFWWFSKYVIDVIAQKGLGLNEN